MIGTVYTCHVGSCLVYSIEIWPVKVEHGVVGLGWAEFNASPDTV